MGRHSIDRACILASTMEMKRKPCLPRQEKIYEHCLPRAYRANWSDRSNANGKLDWRRWSRAPPYRSRLIWRDTPSMMWPVEQELLFFHFPLVEDLFSFLDSLELFSERINMLLERILQGLCIGRGGWMLWMGCDILWILFVCCSNRKICEEGKVYWLVKDIFCL